MPRFFMKGFVANQLPVLVAGLSAFGLLIIWRWRKTGLASSPWASEVRLLALLAASYLSTTLLHATRTATYPTYQTSNVLFVVVFAGIVLGRQARSSRRMQATLMVLAVLIGLAGMPWQEYVVNVQGVGALGKVAEATAQLNLPPRGNGSILTLSPELAVSTRLRLIPGYEMGAFSYFPSLDRTSPLGHTVPKLGSWQPQPWLLRPLPSVTGSESFGPGDPSLRSSRPLSSVAPTDSTGRPARKILTRRRWAWGTPTDRCRRTVRRLGSRQPQHWLERRFQSGAWCEWLGPGHLSGRFPGPPRRPKDPIAWPAPTGRFPPGDPSSGSRPPIRSHPLPQHGRRPCARWDEA
jgi:hypothetical protein